jgi:hypothetical protein
MLLHKKITKLLVIKKGEGLVVYCVGQKGGKMKGEGGGNEKEPKHDTTARSLVDYNTFDTLCTGHSRLHTLKFFF